MSIELSIHSDEKGEELEALIHAMAKFQGTEVKTRRIVQVKTESNELAEAIQMFLPGKVTKTILGKLVVQLKEIPRAIPDLSEKVLPENKKKVRNPAGKYPDKHCAGCGDLFTPKREGCYRDKKCTKINYSQRIDCFTIEDPLWPEKLIGKKLLTKKLDAGELTTGSLVTHPTGKTFRVISNGNGTQTIVGV